MAKIIKSNINSSGSYKSHGNLSSKHHSSSTTRKEKLKGGGTRAVTDSINSTKTINETQNYATTRSTTITSTRKTRSEYFIPLLSMPFWFVIIFLIMAMGTFNVMMDNNGLGKWELKEEYEIDNVYTLSELQDMQLDTPITELNNHSLREVFESTIPALENKVENGDLSDGTTGWTSLGSPIFTVSDGIATIIPDSLGAGIIKDTNLSINTVQYIKVRYKGTLDVRLRVDSGGTIDYRTDYQTSTNYTFLSFSRLLANDLVDIHLVGQSGVQIDVDYIMAFNLTDSHGVTATSGTAYDNAVAEIEWLLSKNDGYIQSVGNPFEIVDLTVSQMDYWYLVYQDILDGSVNKETKAALGTIDYRNPKNINDDIVYLDYYHMTYEQQEKLGLPALNNLTTISTVLVGGKYLDDNNVQKETPGIFPTLTKLITSVTDVIEWFSDNTTKLIRYVDKGYENIVGEKLDDTWKRTKNVWSWLRDQFGIVGGAS